MYAREAYTSTFDGTGDMPRTTVDLLQGTLDLLILKTLSWGPAHGYAIARWIEQLTGNALQIGEGSLYPSLHRLEERGWVTSDWQLSENNRRTKVYTLTTVGRQRLRLEQREWGNFVSAVSKVLDAVALPA
jgi:PadR family transcriptional regulator, regulatory protein PadR